MRIALPSRRNKLLTLSALLLLLAAPLIFGEFHFSHAHAANNTPAYQIQKNIIARAATVEPTKLIAHNIQRVAAQQKPHFAAAKQAAPTANSQVTQVPAATSLSLDNGGHLLRNFPGLTSADDTNINGFPEEPPDQGLCVSGSTVMEIINEEIAFYQRDGTLIPSPVTMNNFFGETLAGEVTFDPRCYFDPQTHAWFAVTTAIDPDFLHSHIDIAVNLTPNPLGSWTVYRIDTTEPTEPGCPCYADFPVFGIDQFNIYLSPNEGSLSGPSPNGGEIFAISKSDLVSLSASIHQVRFHNMTIGGVLAETIAPAYTSNVIDAATNAAQPSAEYFINSFFRTASDSRLGIWALTDQQAVATGGTPLLSNIVINSEPYAQPPLATTPNGYVLTNDDDRIMQVQFINGALWTSLSTAIQVPGSSSTTSGPAWFEIRPQLGDDGSGLKVSGARIVNQGYISTPGKFLLTPTIAASPSGSAVMVMSLSGPNTFPSVVYTMRPAADNSHFGPIHMAAAGVDNIQDYGCTPAAGGVCSWGDFSAAVLDPSNGGDTIWLAGEYISGPTLSQENWGTRIMEVSSVDN